MNASTDSGPSRFWRSPAYVIFMLCCALAAAMFSLPLAAIVAVLAVAPLIISSARATRARNGELPAVRAASPKDGYAGQREFANLPFENPFGPAHADAPLDARITMAAEASAEYSRSVSVLYLATPRNVDPEGVVSIVRASLRPTDHVETTGAGEIVACLNLIRDLSNVDGVIARLAQRLHDNGWPRETPPRIGRALYPMHGYSGADLIDAARRQALDVAEAPSGRRLDPRPYAEVATRPRKRRSG
ncbi:MAG: hypothetical protein QM681_23325, partial [Novosphingobium sp.]